MPLNPSQEILCCRFKYFDIGWSSCYGVFDRQGYTLFWNSKYIFSKIDAFINDAYWSFLDMFSLIPIWCAHDSRHIPIFFISIPNLPISDSLSGTLVYFGFVVNNSLFVCSCWISAKLFLFYQAYTMDW